MAGRFAVERQSSVGVERIDYLPVLVLDRQKVEGGVKLEPE